MTDRVRRRACASPAVLLRLSASALVLLVGVLFSPQHAHAYPWMIRHDYTGCATCHVDPSGGGVLTAYGQAQGDLLLRTHYGPSNSDEPSSTAGFLWGAVRPPDWFLPSGSVRTLGLASKINGAPFTTDFILMQADLRAAVVAGGFRAYASVGAVTSNQPAASVVGNVVSREHWVGWAFGNDGAVVARAGRLDLPFGIRSIEHTMFVRQSTRTDLNDTQQHGASIAYTGDLIRGELMAIAGNYQVSPDIYRERGYSGYLELTPLPNAAFGVSSLVTHAGRDIYLKVPDTRQSHGVFARVSPVRPLVLMLEGDAVSHSAVSSWGYATMLQADLEPIQGLHLIMTGENMHQPGMGSGTSWSGWLGAGWFFAPHADVRLDALRQSLALGPTNVAATALMAQLHVYL